MAPLADPGVDWQINYNLGIFPINTVYYEPATMFAYNAVADAQTQAGSFSLWLGGYKRLFHFVQQTVRDAVAVIKKRHPYIGMGINHNLSAYNFQIFVVLPSVIFLI